MDLGRVRRRLKGTRRLLDEFDQRLAITHREVRELRGEGNANAKGTLQALGRVHNLLQAMGEPPMDAAIAAEMRQVVEQRVADVVAVDQPLVLISQVQRSGGTLLSQLFDGHPQVHAHAHELHLSWPRGKFAWPRLALDDGPETWFEILREPLMSRFFAEGYIKPGVETLDRLPFLLSPALQRRMFMDAVAGHEIRSARDVLDCYMTSYFNAWIDNQNLHGEKRWITAFGARTTFEAENRDAFFADYPDGRLIGIVREPASWYASAARYQPTHYAEIDRAIPAWRQSALSLLDARESYGPERVRLVSFEQLVSDTAATMAELTGWLEIDLPPIALVPTFNRRPMHANSSFEVKRPGIISEAARREDGLTAEDRKRIQALAGDVYERALGAVATPT